MHTHNLLSALSLVSLVASPLAASAQPSSRPAVHRRALRRSPSGFLADLWARRLPITTTTTVTVDATSTQVIWVTATSYPNSAIPTSEPTMNTTSVSSVYNEYPNATASATLVPSATQTGINASATETEWWASATTSVLPTLTSPTAKPNATRTEGWILITDTPGIENATTSAHHFDPSSAAASFASSLSSASSEAAQSTGGVTHVSSATVPNATEVSSTAAIANETGTATGTTSVYQTTLPIPTLPVITDVPSMSISTSFEVSSTASVAASTTIVSLSSQESILPSTTNGVSSSSISIDTPTTTVGVTSAYGIETVSATSQFTSEGPLTSSTSESSSKIPTSTVTASSTAVATFTSSFTAESSTNVNQPSTTSSQAALPSNTLSTTPLNEYLAAAYYPDWSVWTFPPSQIDFSRLDVVDFAFAIVNAQYGLEFTQYNSEDTLNWLVSVAHAAGKKVRLSIGGWTGSVYFSPAVATAENRQVLAQAILGMYNKFGLDGIDVDWEYPGVKGADNNIVSSQDSANFLVFLQLLRQTLPPTAILSTATQVWPFVGSNQAPLSDVSAFAKVLDWVMIMNYDIWGSADAWSQPGPNAPLNEGCGRSDQPLANAYQAVKSWTTAGMPAKQIMLGLPAYGYISASSSDSLRARRRRGLEKKGGVTLYNADGGSTYGQIKFSDIVAQGGLTRDSSGHWVGAGGFTRYWDTCSSTPWLKSSQSGQIITYDDPISISLKAQFARQSNLRGTNFWEITGDTTDWSLLDAARSGLGI
ncbi:hypothetical protein NliqN6_2130 [Naganishia liquefaciens]|uniref:GH18 domain-containing protein n=1 Tax=Naganishia liquefaciens TaxID=104408 RepID=A0A8H3TRT5_9TREE|nr:hypothetical protein NliqN6_2130 [Naganishia liquefaciens]